MNKLTLLKIINPSKRERRISDLGDKWVQITKEKSSQENLQNTNFEFLFSDLIIGEVPRATHLANFCFCARMFCDQIG